MKNKSQKNKKAFTLIEVIIAIFMFVIIVTASSGIFFSTVISVRKARELQQNLERAQLAINEVPKTLRTSVIKDYGADYIVVYDNSRLSNNCIHYRFNDAEKYLEVGSSADDLSFCSITSVTNFGKIVDNYMEDFKVKVLESDSNTVGRVTVSSLICREVGCSSGDGNEIYIQSSVSLRSN